MRPVLLLLTMTIGITCVVDASPKWHELDKSYTFERFVGDFNRRYIKGTPEYVKRKKVFEENLAAIMHHNADPAMTYKKGVNSFTDVTMEEFRGYNRGLPDYPSSEKEVGVGPTTETFQFDAKKVIPATKDWRLENPSVLTSIKQQGMCGACWAFAATETIETHFALKTGQLPVLSVQQITSCSTDNSGCGGGTAGSAMQYVNGTSGLTSEWAYPYVDMFAPEMSQNNTAACKNISKEFKPFNWFNEISEVGVEGTVRVSGCCPDGRSPKYLANNSHVMQALADKGPLTSYVAASLWKDYETGVYQDQNASDAWNTDHYVQMIGYGTDEASGKDYWMIRNSWGTLWGEKGFMKLYKPTPAPCYVPTGNCTAQNQDYEPAVGTSACMTSLQYPKVFQAKTKWF